MKYYNIGTEEMEDRSVFFIVYYLLKRKWFFSRVFLLCRIIRYFGYGVLKEVLGNAQEKQLMKFSMEPIGDTINPKALH
jgi:hypothetical protein